MKKLALVGLFVSLFSAASMAQKAIGVRLGGCGEVSFHMPAADNRFWEFDAGVTGLANDYFGAEAAAIHNWIFAEPNWAPKGDFHWFAGVGLGVGTFWYETVDETTAKKKNATDIMAGVAGMIGLKYNFWFPLQVSADLRPIIGPSFNDGVKFNAGYIGFWPTISARYILD